MHVLIDCSSKGICSYCMYALINGNIICRCCYFSNPNYDKSIWQRYCVPDPECCPRSLYPQEGTIPYCLQGPSTCTWRQKQWPFCCMPSGVDLPRLFVGWLAIQGSFESVGCFCSCHLHNSRTQVDKFGKYTLTYYAHNNCMHLFSVFRSQHWLSSAAAAGDCEN